MREIPILRRFTAPFGLSRLQPQPILRRFATRCHGVNDPQAPPEIKLQKKALIIGIQYTDAQGKLANTHRDAKLWRDLLIRGYPFAALSPWTSLDLLPPLRQVRLWCEEHRDDARRRRRSLVLADEEQHREFLHS